MRQIIALPLVTVLLVQPLLAQEESAPPSLMERGAELFFDGLKQEMGPALREMSKLMEDAGPALQDFMTQMGPKLRDVLGQVEDWSVYEAPKIQPNGDIIIRRKPDAPDGPLAPQAQDMPQIDL
jgi:hypothetical protein